LTPSFTTNYYLFDRLSMEFYSTIIASVFLVAGIYIGITQAMRKKLADFRPARPAPQAKHHEQSRRDNSGSAALPDPLSKRELDVLQLIAAERASFEPKSKKGSTHKQIAKPHSQPGVGDSPHRAHRHVERIMHAKVNA
jgi:hypothetical protein